MTIESNKERRIYKPKLSAAARQHVIHTTRNFAYTLTNTTDVASHIDFLDTVINKGRPNADSCLAFVKKHSNSVKSEVHDEIQQIDVDRLVNLVRRAVGKGGENDTRSKNAIAAFNEWSTPRKAKTSPVRNSRKGTQAKTLTNSIPQPETATPTVSNTNGRYTYAISNFLTQIYSKLRK